MFANKTELATTAGEIMHRLCAVRKMWNEKRRYYEVAPKGLGLG